MKKEFTKEELLELKGCYSNKQIEALFPNQESITIFDILKTNVNIKDKRWFIFNSCDLTLEDKKKLSLLLAWGVLPIFEKKYPNDKRVRNCLEGIGKFNNDEITREDLLILKKSAYDAYADYADYAYDAAAVAAAAYAAADAAADAYTTDAVATADAAYYAAYADDAINKKSFYSEKLNQILIEFFK